MSAPAFLPPTSQDYIGFALAVDIFNKMCYCIPIKSKKKKELKKRFDELFKKSGPFAIIYTDGELQYLRKYFSDKKMLLRTKPKGKHVK